MENQDVLFQFSSFIVNSNILVSLVCKTQLKVEMLKFLSFRKLKRSQNFYH